MPNNINTPYDDVGRTMMIDAKQMLIPVINELYGTAFTGRERLPQNTTGSGKDWVISWVEKYWIMKLRTSIKEAWLKAWLRERQKEQLRE